ncbi:hypothetical protein [Lysobacter soli]|uniref:hypothetical protein n=2 Tax=Lysobacter soli TaxID=453783 RepID=UPI0024101221|nr:hypothetical protein [Lysobacter soli]MDG2519347.1 hypothetical protein [Lysobacter soli]
MFGAAQAALFLMFWLMAGGMLLAGGEPPLVVLLALVGITIPGITANRALRNARKRRGKGMDFAITWEDVANLSSRDVSVHIVSLLIGFGMIAASVAISNTGT